LCKVVLVMVFQLSTFGQKTNQSQKSIEKTLFRLFLIYVSISSHAGEVIREIYDQNISNICIYKHDMLDKMDIMISRKVAMENGIEATQ